MFTETPNLKEFNLGQLSFSLPDNLDELQASLGGEGACVQVGYLLISIEEDRGFFSILFLCLFLLLFLRFISSSFSQEHPQQVYQRQLYHSFQLIAKMEPGFNLLFFISFFN